MADVEYVAAKNYYGSGGMVYKGGTVKYDRKLEKKNLIITEDEYKKLEADKSTVNRAEAKARAAVISKLGSKEVQEVASIVASQGEVITDLTDQVSEALATIDVQDTVIAEFAGTLKVLSDTIVDQAKTISEFITNQNDTNTILGEGITDLQKSYNGLLEVKPTIELTSEPKETPTGEPQETQGNEPEETKRKRRR